MATMNPDQINITVPLAGGEEEEESSSSSNNISTTSSPTTSTTSNNRRSHSADRRARRRRGERAGNRQQLRRVRSRSLHDTTGRMRSSTRNGLILLNIIDDDDDNSNNNNTIWNADPLSSTSTHSASAAIGDGIRPGQLRTTTRCHRTTAPTTHSWTEAPLPSPACCARISRISPNMEQGGVRPGAYATRGRPIGVSDPPVRNNSNNSSGSSNSNTSRSPTRTRGRRLSPQPPPQQHRALTPDDRLSSRSFGIWLQRQEAEMATRPSYWETTTTTPTFDAPVRRQSSNAVLVNTRTEDDFHFHSIPPELRPVVQSHQQQLQNNNNGSDEDEMAVPPMTKPARKQRSRDLSPKRVLQSVNLGTRKIFDAIVDAF